MSNKNNIKQDWLLFFYLLIILGLVFIRDARADDLTKVIVTVRPEMVQYKARNLSVLIKKYSKELKLDWKVYTAMLMQESMLHPDPKGLGVNAKDLGIGQVSWHWWGEELSLDKYRLTYDIEYGIIASYRVLKRMYKQYGREHDWYTRYHSSTPMYRDKYKNDIQVHLKKIKEILWQK